MTVSSWTVVAAISLLAAVPSRAADWPNFRGPSHDGSAVADWPDAVDLETSWKSSLGNGYSGIAAVGGRLYTAFADDGSDWLGAFDAETGEELWRLRLGAEFPALGGAHGGPGATPVASAGRIFAIGGHGALVAAGPEGEEIWRRDLAEEAEAPAFGFVSSPLLVADEAGEALVVQAPGRDGSILFAFDPATGDEIWTFGDDGSVFQSPVVADFAGREQIVVSGDAALYGLSFRGELLWTLAYGAPGPPAAKGRQLNVPLPLGGDRVMVKPSAQNVVAVDVTAGADCGAPKAEEGSEAKPEAGPCTDSAEVAWSSRDLARSYMPWVHHDGVVFGRRGGLAAALDAATGTRIAISRRPADGFFAAADGRLVALSVRGHLEVGRLTADGWDADAEMQVFDDASWTEPTIVGQSIFVRSMSQLARVDVVAAEPKGSADAGKWIDASRAGAELPDTRFGRFVRSLEEREDRAEAVDEFLAGFESFPIVEGEWAHFVYRGPEKSVGLVGDMVGERAQFEMTHVPGTDLFYFTSRLPADAVVSYLFFDDAGSDQGRLDPRNPQTTFWPREGTEWDREPQHYSTFAMPSAAPPDYLEDGAAGESRLETHVFDLSAVEVEVEPMPVFAQLVGERPDEQRIRVYLPKGYDPDRAEPYPTVFVFAGDKVLEGLDARRTLDRVLGDELPAAVVVFVDRHYYFLDSDGTWAFDLHRHTLFERIVPWLRDTYRVGSETYYLGFGYGGAIALRSPVPEESTAGRVALVQPFLLDVNVPVHLAALETVPSSRRPEVYLESSRIDLRASHESWDIAKEHRKLIEAMRREGWDVEAGTNSCGFFWEAWRDRLAPALAFLLTGEAEVPTGEAPTGAVPTD